MLFLSGCMKLNNCHKMEKYHFGCKLGILLDISSMLQSLYHKILMNNLHMLSIQLHKSICTENNSLYFLGKVLYQSLKYNHHLDHTIFFLDSDKYQAIQLLSSLCILRHITHCEQTKNLSIELFQKPKLLMFNSKKMDLS